MASSLFDEAPLTEPAMVSDLFVAGLATIEDRGEYVRLVFWVDHGDPAGTDPPERVVAQRIVMPRSAFEIARNLLKACKRAASH